MELVFKEVYFDQYCSTCIHKDKKESEDPCWDCLNEFVNTYSHKPLYYKNENEKNKEQD